MSEEMNLPESLERLEISPDKGECCKHDEGRGSASAPRALVNACDDPERFLEILSINAVCPKESCLCNKKRENRDKGLKRLVNRRPVYLRRSKLSQAVLRAPILRLPGGSPELSGCSTPLSTTPEGVRPLTALLPEPQLRPDEDGGSQGSSSTSSQEGRRNASATCCAVQARLSEHSSSSPAPTSDDTSMDELASYFDIFVHIPKKMSRMAEMMYI